MKIRQSQCGGKHKMLYCVCVLLGSTALNGWPVKRHVVCVYEYVVVISIDRATVTQYSNRLNNERASVISSSVRLKAESDSKCYMIWCVCLSGCCCSSVYGRDKQADGVSLDAGKEG
ncbi:unnamed protein product, partial [Ectocarpus fasciculatus]